jgi:hypothetical protein
MVTLTLADGSSAELLGVTGERFRLRSSAAAAPGARLSATVARDGRDLRLKVHRCARDGASFAIEGRLLDLTRATRATLLALLGEGA